MGEPKGLILCSGLRWAQTFGRPVLLANPTLAMRAFQRLAIHQQATCWAGIMQVVCSRRTPHLVGGMQIGLLHTQRAYVLDARTAAHV